MTSLSIEILEQPTRYHRFRYEKEVSGGKLGGLLYGRSEKSCVRVRVSNIDPLMQKSVTVIGGTVSPDLYPHPFFMVGDDCRSGTFQLKKDTDSLGGKTEFEISLEKVSLVCVLLRPPDKLQEAVNRRLAINFNPFNKDLTSMSSMYTARNLKPLRLAFQIFVTDYNDVTAPTSAAVYSEEIYDYNCSQFSVHLVEDHNEHDNEAFLEAELRVKMAKKVCDNHLIVAEKPDLTELWQSANERLKCQVVIADKKNNIKDSRSFIVENPRPVKLGVYADETIPTISQKRNGSESPTELIHRLLTSSRSCSSRRSHNRSHRLLKRAPIRHWMPSIWLHISNCPAHLEAPTRREMLSFHNLVILDESGSLEDFCIPHCVKLITFLACMLTYFIFISSS
uniref:RHD domain-containing protein n=1 Tax=Macrostomum lignano TaxID=282301 RepID=A0A1I8IUN8_9PLAT